MKAELLTILEGIPTRFIQEELDRRAGVQSFVIGPYVPFKLYIADELVLDHSGPCTITHNYD